jgi:hypothetical protein
VYLACPGFNSIIAYGTYGDETSQNRSRYGFTPYQIYICLTSDVRNHTGLKNKIKSRYGKTTQVNEAFSYYGF